MARKRRRIISNTAYHVTARANRQEFILEDNYIKTLFLATVKRAKKKYSFCVKNFCIMGNHIHMDIEPLNNNSLSDIMQWILSVFAIHFNKHFGYKGHVWYDRFKSTVIENWRQFVNTFYYIANNPVRAGIVNHPLKFAFNGITHYKNNTLKGILDPPNKKTLKIIEEYLNNFDLDKARKVDENYSFLPKTPGRKKKS